MKGGIYTDQKCDVCGSTLKDDGHKKLCRPDHPGKPPTTLRVHCGKSKRQFKSYPEAQRFLPGIRSKTDENSFDERDSSSEKPLGFQNPAGKWLEVKKETVKPRSCRNPHSSIMKARNAWGNEKEKNSSVPFFPAMHQTNKAFERYFRVGADDIRKIYQETSIQKQTSVTNLKRPLRNK
jgi:hypothetical protein